MPAQDDSLTLSAATFAGRVKSYFPFWDSYFRPYLLDGIDLLPAEHFDFKPRPEMMTARQVILHIAEVERMWVHHVWEKEPYEDFVRKAEVGFVDAYDAPDHNTLKFVLEEYHRHSQRLFGLPASELDKKTTRLLKDGTKEEYTLHWILAHVEEHELHHRTQLFLYLRMLGITPPPV